MTNCNFLDLENYLLNWQSLCVVHGTVQLGSKTLPYKTIQSFSEIRSNEVNWKGFDLGVFGLIIPAAFSLLQVTSPKK